MVAASARGWGDPGSPGSATQKAYRRDNIVTARIAGVDWLVHRKFEPILRELLERHVVPVIGPLTMRADDWSYAPRCIRGTGPGTSRPCVMSNHAWGLAVDVNATQNVMGGADPDGQFPPDFGDRLHHLKIRWGGDFTSTKDPMHFEFVGTPEDAERIAAIIEREDDMALDDADVARVAKATAAELLDDLKRLAQWSAGKENVVFKASLLDGAEKPMKRSEVLDRFSAIEAQIAALQPGTGGTPAVEFEGDIVLRPKT